MIRPVLTENAVPVCAKQAGYLVWLRAFQQSQGPALSAACSAQT